MEEETVVETPPWEAFKPANSGPWQDFAAPSGPWADFQSAPVDRAMRKADLQAQQAAARSELLPRLAVQLVEPSPPAGLYRDMEQGFAPTRPNTLEQFSQPLANPLNAQTVARGLDVLAGAAEFARQGAVNPNASTAMDERLARDVQPGVGSQIAAGVQQAAAGLTSPAGAGLMAATAGVGALPRLAQRGVSAGFAAWMAANAGTNAGELVNAFEADDVEGFARAATSLGMDATFATLSGLHAVKGIAGDRVPTGNTRPDGTPETRPAAYAQAVNRWLTGQVEKNFTPEQVRDMYRRVNTGEATAQEQELVRVINRQIESPGQALRQGVDVTTPGQPLVSPWLRDFLALTQGEPGVRLADGQRSAAGSKPSPTESAAAPLSANRSPLSSRPSLLSPPETVPPEAVVPSTATPAPAGTPLPPPLAPNPAPISSSLRTRPEATMETRPTAPLGLQREPTVSPELADTIQALRQGYQQQLDVPAETSNVQRPTTIPDLPTFVAQAIAKEMAPDVNVELVRRRFGAAEAAAAKSSKPTAAEAEMIARAKARAEQQGWAWSEVLRKVQQQLGLDDDFLPEGGNDAIQLAAMRKQDALDAARAQRFDASLASLPTTPAPKTPPDQSGAPTELTPPAKVEAEATIEIGDTALYVDPSRPNKPPVKVAISSIRQLPNDAEMMAEFNYFGPKRVPVSKLKLHDKSQAFKMREMAKRNKAADAATRAQPTPPDQSGGPTAKPSTPAAGQAAPAPPAKAEKIPWRVGVSKDEVFVESDGGRVSRFGWAKVFKSGDQWKAQVFSDQGKALHFVAETDSKAKATKAAKEWAQRQIKTDLLDDATEWIKDVVILKRPPKNSDEAWVSFRKNMMADTRGTAVVDEATFKELWDLFATRIAEVRAAAHPKPTPPDQSGGPTELTPPAQAATVSPPSARGAAAGGTGTITGSNERRGSEMPAEAGSTPAPTEADAPRRSKQQEVAARKAVKAAAQEFDRLVLEWGVPLGWVQRPELMAQRFAREGLDTVSIKAKILQGKELKAARTRAASTFTQLTGVDISEPEARAKLLPQLKEYLAPRMAEREQSQQFDQKVLQGQRPAGQEDSVQMLSADSLRPGDTFTVQGHGFTVEQVFLGEDGRVTGVKVQDGPKFGVQTVGAEDYLHIDFDSLERGEPAAGNDFALNAPESVEEQKARLAQEQAQRDAQAQRDRLAELQAKPLTGTTGDLGQGSLLDAPQDLFAPPSPGGGSANASVGDFRAPVPARPAPVPEVPAGAGFADSGLFVDGVEVRLGGSGAVNPVLMPEVYRIYNALTGGDSPFLRRYRSANGMFYAAGAGRIGLHPDLFKFPHQAAYTFAHEVGHLGDYLPDRTLDRGNLFGSIGTLRHWLTTTFPLNPSTPLDDVLKGPERKKLYSRAYNETKRALGPRPNKEESEVDWAVWGEELSKRYQEMVEEVIDERGLIPLKQVRDELLTLTQWWKPYDPATAPESYRKYRESARELYADALSVLFNSPGHLEQMAPTFYKMFWAWLDTKPEFKAALARTQELLAKGDAEVLRARVADDRADFEKGRAAFEAAHAEQERTFTDVRAITARLMRQLVDRGEALTELSSGPRLGGVLPQGMDPREAWEQMLMADNLIYQFSSAVAERVVKPLQDAGLNADTDIGVYLKHTRIQGNKSAREELDLIKARLGRATYTQAEKFADLMEELVRKGVAETQMIDRVILPAEAAGIEFDDITEISRLRLEQGTRVDIANPRLVQAAESERTLAQYLADLGPAKAQALEQAAAAFRDIGFNLVEQGHAAQVFTDRQFETAKANRHTYAAFRPLDHVDTWVSWTMRRAKGSAKPIENPFVTTMLKMQGLAQAIMENRAKLATRDAMQPVAPESFVKAETYWTGRGQQAKPPAKDMARLIVREQGKPVAYDVDPAIAEAFEKLTPFEQDTAAAWVNWLFHKTLYRGYVSWSLPFNFWTNPNRDIRRTYLNLGAVFGKRAPSMTDLARAYKDAWADAKAYVAGELTPLSREAMEFYAIYAPTDAFYSQFPQDDPSHAIFVKLGLVAEPASKARAMADKVPVLKQALAVGDWVTRQGQQREAVGKLGTWLALRRAGFEPEQAAPFVRNYAGTPNTKVSGSGSAVPNAIFPFYRIWMQALRNWAKLVRNPKTRGGWMFRWAITAGTLRALLGLAGLGYFGKELKDWIDGVPEYDRTRGVPVPVPPLALPGGDYGKKSLYLRLPDDEFSALMGYSLDNAMRAAAGQKGAGQAASDAAAQWLTSAPALNTFADLTAQWLAYAGNGVPEDRFRNRPVLTEPERKAGGAQAFGKMVAFSLDKAGVPMLRQPASEPGSDAEQVLRFTPLLKDMFKVSDAGFREKDMAQRDAVEQVKYAIRMDYGDDTKYLLHRHAVLDRAGTTRTLAQEAEYAFLKRWHADYNRLDAAIVAAQQQNERGEAKERIRDLETASTAYKTAMEQAKAERERLAGPRAVPWSPRLTNAVPARR